MLAEVPPWIWDGESLLVPVEDIADSCFGLLVRDVDDLSSAPGVPTLADDHTLSGLLLPGIGEIWVNASEAHKWPTRRRFTIGNEPGHYGLHHSQGDAVWCRTAVWSTMLALPLRLRCRPRRRPTSSPPRC